MVATELDVDGASPEMSKKKKKSKDKKKSKETADAPAASAVGLTPGRKNAVVEETLFRSRGPDEGSSSAMFAGLFDSKVKPLVQELFEKYARSDHYVDAKGIQAMCYVHATFILDVVTTSMRRILKHADSEDDNDDDESGDRGEENPRVA